MGQFDSTASRKPDLRVETEGREAQDHELAGGIDGPSPRPEANDGQWSQDPEAFEYDEVTQPMQGWYEEEDVLRFGAAVRDMMRDPYPPRQAQQTARGNR